MTAADSQALRRAFGTFPTGVTVVTARAADGTPVGFTANSFTSVSIDPPLLLVCPSRSLTSYAVFESCTRFAVNVLSEEQQDVSNVFAACGGDRFAHVDWSGAMGTPPVLDNVAASFQCRTDRVVPAGDHIILIGAVETFHCSGKPGLGYAAGRYFSLPTDAVPERRKCG